MVTNSCELFFSPGWFHLEQPVGAERASDASCHPEPIGAGEGQAAGSGLHPFTPGLRPCMSDNRAKRWERVCISLQLNGVTSLFMFVSSGWVGFTTAAVRAWHLCDYKPWQNTSVIDSGNCYIFGFLNPGLLCKLMQLFSSVPSSGANTQAWPHPPLIHPLYLIEVTYGECLEKLWQHMNADVNYNPDWVLPVWCGIWWAPPPPYNDTWLPFCCSWGWMHSPDKSLQRFC